MLIYSYSSYLPEDGKIIKIGRSNDVDISIEDDLLSRFHCYITFHSAENCWKLVDGIFDDSQTEKSKASTNGTWVYLKDDIELSNDFVFKSNHCVFKVFVNS